jgi:hypothetical protein
VEEAEKLTNMQETHNLYRSLNSTKVKGSVKMRQPGYIKVKVKVKQFRYRPGVEFKVPRLHDNGTGW